MTDFGPSMPARLFSTARIAVHRVLRAAADVDDDLRGVLFDLALAALELDRRAGARALAQDHFGGQLRCRCCR